MTENADAAATSGEVAEEWWITTPGGRAQSMRVVQSDTMWFVADTGREPVYARSQRGAVVKHVAQTALADVVLEILGPCEASRREIARAAAESVAKLGTVLEGRTTPPDADEAEAHRAAGGLWRWVATKDGEAIHGCSRDLSAYVFGRELADLPQRIGSVYAVRYWKCDAAGRIVV